MTRDVGLYLHIPYCVRKCSYCDFPSYTGREDTMQEYVNAVISEMRRKADPDIRISTVYVGGGTPSLLPPRLMDHLLSALRDTFSIADTAEWSCECNPGTVTEGFLRVLRRRGVNRLSFGAQASQDHLLQMLGRIHSWRQVEQSVALARSCGFDNINLDLMLGLPFQTLDDVRDTLNAALALSPTHVSCYGLIVEEGTRMQEQVDSGRWPLPDEEQERAMYELCRETLFSHGFRQYEISNFSLSGRECRHNLDCWHRKEYIGLGCSACGFLKNIRSRNPAGLDDYLRGAAEEDTLVSPQDAMFETMMLGLRTMEGVSEEDFFRMHGVSLREVYGEKLAKSLSLGLVVWENGVIRLTRRGMDVQNAVLVDLL